MLGFLKLLKKDRRTYPCVLTGEHGEMSTLAVHHASIVAIATAADKAEVHVTEEFRHHRVSSEIEARLVRAGYAVEYFIETAANIQSRYGYHSVTESTTTTRNVSSLTAIFDQYLKEAVLQRAAELRFCVRAESTGVVHNIDGRVYLVHSIDGTQGMDICSNAYTSLSDQKSLEAGKNTFSKEQDQSCIIMRTIDGVNYRLRYQSMPEADGGFDVTLRILKQGSHNDIPSLEKLNFTPSTIAKMKRAMKRRRGAIYMAGPVGGGKTTALYALMYRPVDERHQYVITLEDPVEYFMPGITRVPVEKIGYGNAVKRMLRMGAHTVMIGEIRDHDMGFVAKVLSETGQKVTSTVHVNSAPKIIDRLCGEEIGLPREAMCDTDMIAGLFYTSLLPKLCTCSLHANTSNMEPRWIKQLDRLGIPLSGVRVPNPKGCGKCKAGRYGRVPVVEIIEPDEQYLRLMREGKDGAAKDYWLESCTTPVTDEDVTGKPKMATALYRVSIGELHVGDLEENIDLIDTYNHRQRSPIFSAAALATSRADAAELTEAQ